MIRTTINFQKNRKNKERIFFMKKKFVNIHRLFAIISLLIVLSSHNLFSQEWSLEQCIDSAMVNNKSIRISKNNMKIADAKQDEALLNLLPKINSITEYKYYFDLPYQLMPQSAFGGPEGKFKETQFGVPHNINANIQFVFPIYNSQIYGAITNTSIAKNISSLQLDKNKEQIIYDISILYYNLQILIEQKKFVENNIQNNEKLLANVNLLRENLLAKGTDIAKIELLISQLNAQKDQLEYRIKQLGNSLKFIIGLSDETEFKIDTEIIYEEKSDYQSKATADLLILHEQNSLLRSELKNLYLNWMPSLNLVGTYGQTGYGYDEAPNEFLDFYPYSFVGLQLNIPLFTGRTNNKKISQKEIEIQNNDLQKEIVLEQNKLNIDNSKNQRTSTLQTIKNTKKSIELAKELYNQTINQQKEGLANLTDVLLADSALRESQQNYLNAVIDYLKSDIELRKYSSNLR